MVEEALSNFGLFIDDENKIRLIDPERVTDSAELRDECKDFTDSMNFIELITNVFFFCLLRCLGIQENRRYINRKNGSICQTS
jgi:hypothetical protein